MRLIEQIKSAVRCDEYIGALLTVRGGRAICPFHDERSASLVVHEAYWKCFGCGAGGDVVAFAARFHRVSILAAVRLLAAEAGIALDRQAVADPYAAAKADRVRREAEEWRERVRVAIRDSMHADDWDRIEPYYEWFLALPKAAVLAQYTAQRTREQAAGLRVEREPTVEALVGEYLAWERRGENATRVPARHHPR